MMQIQERGNRAKWVIMYRDIESKIVTGEYPAGKAILSVTEMAKKYHAGHATVQRAYEELNKNGLIESKKGVGCYVKDVQKEVLIRKCKSRSEESLRNAVQQCLNYSFSPSEVTAILNDVLDGWKEQDQKC